MSSSDLMRFITMLRMWNSLFFSSEIFSTCLLFSISISSSFIVKPCSARRVVPSPPPLPFLLPPRCSNYDTLFPSLSFCAFSDANTSKMEPETCCSLK